MDRRLLIKYSRFLKKLIILATYNEAIPPIPSLPSFLEALGALWAVHIRQISLVMGLRNIQDEIRLPRNTFSATMGTFMYHTWIRTYSTFPVIAPFPTILIAGTRADTTTSPRKEVTDK